MAGNVESEDCQIFFCYWHFYYYLCVCLCFCVYARDATCAGSRRSSSAPEEATSPQPSEQSARPSPRGSDECVPAETRADEHTCTAKSVVASNSLSPHRDSTGGVGARRGSFIHPAIMPTSARHAGCSE